jgi:hypothetical protein
MPATVPNGGRPRLRRRSDPDKALEVDASRDGTRRRRQPDGRVVSIRDVAAEAGVSVATVSRVLTPESDYPVRPETREGVIKAAARMGYRPNDLARALLQGRTGTVGVLIPESCCAIATATWRGPAGIWTRS